MNEKELIKVFYEDIITNNTFDEIDKYIADESIVRIGTQRYQMERSV